MILISILGDDNWPDNVVSLEEFTFPCVEVESLLSCDRCEHDCETQEDLKAHIETIHGNTLSSKCEFILEEEAMMTGCQTAVTCEESQPENSETSAM